MGNRVILLVNDTAAPGLMAEHGLSIWIEVGDQRILLDTGQGEALAINAWELGLDLAQINALVLSHGHYDHTGAMAEVLARSNRIDLFCHSAAVQPRYAVLNGKAKSIQMPDASVMAVSAWADDKVHWVSQPCLLADGVGLTGPIPRVNSYEDPGGPFYLDEKGTRPDPIEDDQALWINTGRGLVVCVGCCHAGVINTLNYARRLSGQAKIRAVIGGFHLLTANDHRLDQTVAAIQEMSPDWIVPCHCTGDHAIQLLMDGMGKRVRPGRSGMILAI